MAVGQQTTAATAGGLGELSQSDLSSLVPPINEEQGQIADTEDIFKQLSETTFEIDNFLNEFNTTEIKVLKNFIGITNYVFLLIELITQSNSAVERILSEL